LPMLNAVLLAVLQATPRSQPLLVPLIWMVSFGAIAWFLLIRPQRRLQQQQQHMLSALKKGDEVMTEGGIIGTIVHLTDERVTVRTAENTRVVIARPKIARVLSGTSEQGS
jgi:preprotein translocase subunit YajC